MELEEQVSDWVVKRPPWQQDVLSRLAGAEIIDDADIEVWADRLVGGSAVDAQTISAPVDPVEARSVSLTSIGDLVGINALVSDVPLTFGETGLTIVFGTNGSGKSGYARLLKSVSRARVEEEVLADAFSKKPPEQRAVINFFAGSAPERCEWTGPGDVDAALQGLHFYDRSCGADYLKSDSEVTYQPSGLSLLRALIVICDRIAAVLDQRLASNRASKPSLPSVTGGGDAAGFLERLSDTTERAEVESWCTERPGDRSRRNDLHAEEGRLKATNSETERARIEKIAQDLRRIVSLGEVLTDSLSPARVTQFVNTRTAARERRAAADVASSVSFDDEPIDGVGSETWRSLWDASRTFSEADVYPDQEFPVTDEARCVLCQQELGEEAGDRLHRFHRYMTDTTERDASMAEARWDQARSELQVQLAIPPAVTAAIAALQAADHPLAAVADRWLTSVQESCAALASWASLAVTDTAPAPDIAIDHAELKRLTESAAQHEADAAAINSLGLEEDLRGVSTELSNLQDRLTLVEHRDKVEKEVHHRRDRAAIEKARRAVNTGPITTKIADLTRTLVTEAMADQFDEEARKLRLTRVALTNQASSKGKVNQRPSLVEATIQAPIERILSDGEQTALGLAGLFTEVEFDESRSALVLDDPVTSLDHIRRGRVAERLVDFARTRQVVVFSHDIIFVDELVAAAKEASVLVTDRSVEVMGGDRPGHCTNEHPWEATDAGKRIDELRSLLAHIKRERRSWASETYHSKCADWGGKLSETWERAINMEILNQVFDRGSSEVRPGMFRVLTKVSTEDQAEFEAGYRRASTWSRRHDKAPETGYAPPEPDDMEEEITRPDTWLKRIKSYRS